MVELLALIPAVAACLLGFLFVVYLAVKINRREQGGARVRELSLLIHKGALAYLNKQYVSLVFFALVVTAVLAYFRWEMALAFLVGALFSAVAGSIGMRIATIANGRTAHACEKGAHEGLNIAFSSGAVMGLTVVSLGLFGVLLLYSYFGNENISFLYAFGFGASSIALFARVGGGIYTKGADVAADIVGKVEAGIPEDDPRNPAVIADQVGDNVGDVAGMGSDLFESYVDSIIAAMILGAAMVSFMPNAVLLPIMLAALGILVSILGTFFVRAGKEDPAGALNRGIWASALLMLIGSYFLIDYFVNGRLTLSLETSARSAFSLWLATAAGLVGGVIIGMATEYYTSESRPPAQKIAAAAKTGAGTVLIAGLANGMVSTVVPVIIIGAAIMVSYQFAGIYGIALAAVGMLSTLGITLAADTYGPVVDNAAGIAEMAGLGKEVRRRAEKLDAVGNTTAAMGKGFAIGSAALTALALFSSYALAAKLSAIDVAQPAVVVGLFLGAMLPFLFCAFTMSAVGNAANRMIEEIRRQFRTIKGIMKGTAKPDYEKCISISTEAALREMVVPGMIAVLAPVAVCGVFGLAFGMQTGLQALGGMLAGSIATGFMLALLMANAGGAWDNAKKFIEAGNYGGKGSEAHKAAVVGDMVGDPFKDTAGPGLNILIKLMTIIALLIATLGVAA